MPYQNVMPEFGRGELHSGSKSGPRVTTRKQAIAIMLSEKKKGTDASSSLSALKKHAKG